MAIDFVTFRDYAIASLMARHPVMMRGPHGIGKSTVAYDLAKEIGEMLGHSDYPVVEARISQKTEGDISGIPVVNGKYTIFLPPWFLHEAMTKPVCLFFDEVDRGIPEVRQAIMELTDSRKCDGRFLHEDTVILAATNSGEGSSKYQTGELDAAENDRWAIWDVKITHDTWLDWAHGKVDKVIWDFISKNPEHLIYDLEQPFVPGKRYPSPRSWERYNKAVKVMEKTKGGFGKEANPSWLFGLACGYLGDEAAFAFRDFFTNYDHQVEISEILVDGKFELAKDWDIVQHGAFCKKMLAQGWFDPDEGQVFKDDTILNNAAHYLMEYVDPELFMKVFVDLSSLQQNRLDATSTAEVKNMPITTLSRAENLKGEKLFRYFAHLVQADASV